MTRIVERIPRPSSSRLPPPPAGSFAARGRQLAVPPGPTGVRSAEPPRPAATESADVRLGEAGSRFEREAEQVARHATVSPASTTPLEPPRSPSRSGVTSATGGAVLPSWLGAAVRHQQGGGRPLDTAVRLPMERTLEADLSTVRVHTDQAADGLNRAFDARAFTLGHDVFFRRGELRPGIDAGRELLAHELTHVVQQGAGAGSVVQRTEFNVPDGSPRGVLLDISEMTEAQLKFVEDNLSFFVAPDQVPQVQAEIAARREALAPVPEPTAKRQRTAQPLSVPAEDDVFDEDPTFLEALLTMPLPTSSLPGVSRDSNSSAPASTSQAPGASTTSTPLATAAPPARLASSTSRKVVFPPSRVFDSQTTQVGPYTVPHKGRALITPNLSEIQGEGPRDTPLWDDVRLRHTFHLRSGEKKVFHRERNPGIVYDRAHMIANQFGGKGSPDNVVPTTAAFNLNQMRDRVEGPLATKRRFGNSRSVIFDYRVEIEYAGQTGSNLSPPEKLLPSAFNFETTEFTTSLMPFDEKRRELAKWTVNRGKKLIPIPSRLLHTVPDMDNPLPPALLKRQKAVPAQVAAAAPAASQPGPPAGPAEGSPEDQ